MEPHKDLGDISKYKPPVDKTRLRDSLIKYGIVDKMSLKQAVDVIHYLYVIEPIMKS